MCGLRCAQYRLEVLDPHARWFLGDWPRCGPKPNEVQLKERIAELERTQTQLLSHLESIESKIGALQSEEPLVHGQIFSDLMVPEAIR